MGAIISTLYRGATDRRDEGQPLDLHAVRQQHGGTVYDGGRRWQGPGPGHSRRDTSLSVWISDTGRPLLYSFAGDPLAACEAHLGLEARSAVALDQATVVRLRKERDQAARVRENQIATFCRSVISGAEPVEGTRGEAYLQSRAIDWLPADVLFHGTAPRGYASKATAPALLAVVRSSTGAPKGLQATFLTPTGGKLGRVTFGALLGGAVRLSPLAMELAIGEGVESCASFASLQGIPTWAALGTANLEAFTPPTVVRHLVIAADGDEAGMKSAHVLAERLRHRCDVTIMPAPAPHDWNDVAAGKASV